jgi:hypothetical protein
MASRPENSMKLKNSLAGGLVVAWVSICLMAYAEEHGRMARSAPPPFQAHPGGVHPRGPTVRPHQVRVLQPRGVVHGQTGWQHWNHPDFARPNYYWEWNNVHTVTCTAEDSYGDQYPVSEATPPGFGFGDMTGVEDDALDRCYSESGQDSSCVLATCTHI